MAGHWPAIRAVQGTVSGLWKINGISNGSPDSSCIAAYLEFTAGEDSPNLYLDQLISKVVTQGGFPNASPMAKTV